MDKGWQGEVHFVNDPFRCARIYGLELARHASHIASTLNEKSLVQEILSAVTKFRQKHGTEDLHDFLCLLARRLEERGRLDAVDLVLHCATCGEADMLAGIEPGPVSPETTARASQREKLAARARSPRLGALPTRHAKTLAKAG
jgi:hypothetical protein